MSGGGGGNPGQSSIRKEIAELKRAINSITKGSMKHCQITGVEMPDEKKARDEAAERIAAAPLGEIVKADIIVQKTDFEKIRLLIEDGCKQGWDARAEWQAKRDIRHTYKSEIYTESISSLEMADNVNDPSAEFPEKDFELWFNTPLPDRSCRTICKYWFERGRLSNVDERDQNRRLANRNADLNDKLEQALQHFYAIVNVGHADSYQTIYAKEAIAKIKGEKK